MNNNNFGQMLRKLRVEKGLTLHDLSERSGVHHSTISRLETEPSRRPHMETFIHLAKGFELSIQELAILTELIDPKGEEVIVVRDKELKTVITFLKEKNNLDLIKIIKELDPIARYHLSQFVHGLQNSTEDESKVS